MWTTPAAVAVEADPLPWVWAECPCRHCTIIRGLGAGPGAMTRWRSTSPPRRCRVGRWRDVDPDAVVDYEPDAEAIARAYAPPLLAPVFVPATAEGLEVARRLIAEMDRITAAARVVRVDTDDWAPWVAARAAESRSELGLEVQRRRLEAGWTCRRLAAELGVAASTVSRVERGEMGPADAAVALAAWLGWTPEEVLLGATAPERER